MSTSDRHIPTPAQYLTCFLDLPTEVQNAIEELSKPWPVEQIQIRPGAVNRDGTSAMALAYHDWWTGYLPRLNDIVGPNNFKIRLQPWNDDVIAHLRAFGGVIEGWSSGSAKQDKLGPMEAEIQAKKRVVAEKLLLGLYLYFLPTVWMRGEYDAQRKQFYLADGEEQRCAYELYARAGLIARPHLSAAVPRPPPDARPTPTPPPSTPTTHGASPSERVSTARALLESAERTVGMRPPQTPDFPISAPVLASDKQLGLIITMVGKLHTANPAALNAIGARFQIAELARFTAREQLPALRAQAGGLTRLDASKLIDQLKACAAPLTQTA
jgi:hypothetical protein